jgi:hypothetical protein
MRQEGGNPIQKTALEGCYSEWAEVGPLEKAFNPSVTILRSLSYSRRGQFAVL